MSENQWSGQVEDGRIARDVSISVLRANATMFAITLPLTGLLALGFIRLWGVQEFLAGFFRFLELPGLLAVILIGVPLHELLHAAGWKFLGRTSIHDIRLGFQWKLLTPYAHLKVPVSAYGYRMGTFLPGLAQGFLPYIVGTVIGNSWICMLGLFFIFAAGGDLLTLWIIRGLQGSDRVVDHPARVGCLVLEENGA